MAPVTIYDIDWDLSTPAGVPRVPWDQMSAEDADDQLALSHELGETLSEYEYLTHDRAGRLMRIVLLKTKTEADPDSGAVYEYAL